MKHLIDHRKPAGATRMQQFLRVARDRSESAWRGLWQKPHQRGATNRKAVEFARIERGRSI
jgi:hypothetical protein